MKIRSYKGSSLEKIYAEIRKDLGPDAIVIPTGSPDRKSILHPLAGGARYEVIAVADDAVADRHMLDMLAAPSSAGLVNDRQLDEIKQAIHGLGAELQGLSGGVAGGRAAGSLPEFASDWDERFVHRLKAVSPDIFKSEKRKELKTNIANMLNVDSNFMEGKKKPHVIVFVGPTGSGKTTTLAKLAALWALEKKMKVGIITTDTFRVAAVDQIKEYAALMALETSVAFSASEAAGAVEKFAAKDVILVDTPGRNHYDRMGLASIRGVLQSMGPVTVLLHIPATLDAVHVSDLMDNFKMLSPDYVVMTKVDETRRFGAFTSVACRDECPVAFITDGQRVPQDIHAAVSGRIVNILVPDEVPDERNIAAESCGSAASRR